MRALRWSASVLALLLATAPALAETATSDGAKALGQSFAAYFGQSAIDRGIISVLPKGDDYEVTFDLQRVVDGFNLPAGSLRIGSFAMLTTPQLDGTWKVKSDGFPNVAVRVPSPKGEISGSFALSGYRFDGVYDPKLAAFLTATNTVDLIDMKWAAEGTDVSLQESGYATELRGADAGSGAVTVTVGHKLKSIFETVKVTPPARNGAPPPAPVSIVYNVGPVSGDGTIEAMRSRSMLDLWAFLVGLNGVEHVIEHQSELKEQLLKVLPLWNSAKVQVSMNDIAAEFPFGTLGLKSFGETIALSGATPQGAFELGMKFSDLSVPTALLPPWSNPLLPTALETDIKVQIQGLDKVVRAAIEDCDLAASPPLSQESQAKLAAMLLGGEPKLVIAPSRLVSPSFELSVEGELALTPPKPTGRLTVGATGLDKTLAIIQAAAQNDPKLLQQALMGLTFLKGLAKQGADGKSVWALELGPDGAVTINGQRMGPPAK
ncbi:MAG: DUF2125 domain-containing protein [Hyphomicrobiales bacterium]